MADCDQNFSDDDDFIEQLRMLSPVSVESQCDRAQFDGAQLDGGQFDGSITAESIVYQAGYRAACEQRVVPPVNRRHWRPVLAASLITAAMTLPLAYRVGQSSTRPTSEQIARRGVSDQAQPAADDDVTELAPRLPVKAAVDEAAKQRQPGMIASDVARTEPATRSSLAQIWRSMPSIHELPPQRSASETLTAFLGTEFDDIPRSNWDKVADGWTPPGETFAAGDLGEFTLGLEVNQR